MSCIFTTSPLFLGGILGLYFFQNDLNHFATLMYMRHSFISKKVVYNYLALIFVEKILSGIDIKRIVTCYIWRRKGVFLFDLQFDELFLVSLFVYWGSRGEPKLKEKHPPTPLGWIKKEFSAIFKLQKICVFSLTITFKGIYCIN